MKTPLAILGLALVLGGCDPVYGVERDSYLWTAPKLDCVQRAIEVTNGVATVSMHERHRGKGLFHPTPWIYDYVYSGPPGSGVFGSLQVIKTYDGKFSYHNASMRLHAPPPQADIDNVRPVMRAIEKNLASRCGIYELNTTVQETCTGVTCKPLTD